MKRNTPNQLFYSSQVFKAKEDQRSNFAFSACYFIQDEHGSWTRDLDLIYQLYIEEFKFINAVDKALYDYCKSLANRRQRLSIDEIAANFGECKDTIIKRFDRLQDCLLGHRVYRSDLHGIGTFDFVVHTPFTKAQLNQGGYAILIRERIKNQHTKRTRQGKLTPISYTTKKNVEVTRLNFNRESIPRILQVDFRELRQLYHIGLTKEETNDKVQRKFWKSDTKSDVFFAVCLDGLREMRKQGFSPIPHPDQTEVRTNNWKAFKGILKRFCEIDYIDIELTGGRYKAAWSCGNYYAPNLFTYIPI